MTKRLIGLCMLLMAGVLAMEDADARRFGGGRSTGVQRSVPSTPPASTPARPAQQQAAPAQQAQPQATGLSRWMPMLGGLALGGMLGYLFAGNGLGGILLLALLAVGGVLLFRALARKRAGTPQRMQYAGLGQGEVFAPPPQHTASSLPATGGASRLPADFDAAAFLRGAKMNFVKLQLANDQGKLDEIRDFTTDELFGELQRDVAERRGASQQTDIEALEAELVDVATEGANHWASVRFSGWARETPAAEPVQFTEVWNLVKPADGSSGWLLAGIQQMH
jgi:predicted lipid-binding transport protein (Tim44 family)